MTVLDINEIKKILPHRYPMLLVDRILEVEPMKRRIGRSWRPRRRRRNSALFCRATSGSTQARTWWQSLSWIIGGTPTGLADDARNVAS